MTQMDVLQTDSRKQADSLSLTQKLAGALTNADSTDGWQQYVSFSVAGDEYGVDIMVVREIKAWTSVTPLPNTPEYVRGVLNLRGVIVPIFDLRCRFSGIATEPTSLHVVIIMMVHDRMMGILVDAVSDIISVGQQDVMAVPELEQQERRRFLSGIVTHSDHMVALLALEQIFDLQEILTHADAED